MGEEIRGIGFSFAIDDVSRIADARRRTMAIAESEGLSDSAASNAAIIASEIATNLRKHAKRGEIQVHPLSGRDVPGVEILSIDHGPGIANLERCFEDGYSSGGTSGTGLGAIRRLSDEFDIYSVPEQGTVLMSRIVKRESNGSHPPSGVLLGLAERPLAGETISGDAWGMRVEKETTLLMVADGLGHGIQAAEASHQAIQCFKRSTDDSPTNLVQRVHGALRGTRGAAIAIASVEFGRGQVRFSGVGNIAGVVVTPLKMQSMISHNGTAGHEVRQISEFLYPLTEDGIVVMHSDGLSNNWNFNARLGLLRHHPSIIAAVLYRDAARDRDDVCVIVGRKR